MASCTTFPRRVALLLLPIAALSLVVAAAPLPMHPATAAETLAPRVLFLVRHAEKAAGPPKDPLLSEAGSARAIALADLLVDAGVTHLFASEFQRTQLTLAPLAQRIAKTVTVVNAGDPAALIATLQALPPGAVAVVAGHSNTLPPLVRGLGGTLSGTETTPRGEMLPDTEYGRVMQLILPSGADGATAPVTSLRLHVGAR